MHSFASLSDSTIYCVGPVAFRRRIARPQEHSGIDLSKILYANFPECAFFSRGWVNKGKKGAGACGGVVRSLGLFLPGKYEENGSNKSKEATVGEAV